MSFVRNFKARRTVEERGTVQGLVSGDRTASQGHPCTVLLLTGTGGLTLGPWRSTVCTASACGPSGAALQGSRQAPHFAFPHLQDSESQNCLPIRGHCKIINHNNRKESTWDSNVLFHYTTIRAKKIRTATTMGAKHSVKTPVSGRSYRIRWRGKCHGQ